jgi:uncharacterized protein with PIN domain
MSAPRDTIPPFIADTMLGKLSRWMGLLGYDIIYAGVVEDEDLARQASVSGRTILTRDTRLAASFPETRVFLINSTDPWRQLREVIEHFPMDFAKTAFSRCTRCNASISRVEKEDVLENLPPLVSLNQEAIYQCPECGKLYWEASHVDHIKSLLKERLGLDL